MRRSELALVLTCEHGGCTLPPAWRARFAQRSKLLHSHRGWDAGALSVARYLARRLGAPLVGASVTRLLVDLNRSPGNPAALGRFGRELPVADQRALLERWHAPHRARVRAAVDREVRAGRRVLHVGVHSFTPVLDGRPRAIDVGLLYDPRRSRERTLAGEWRDRLVEAQPDLRVRRNAPYRGDSDGLTTALRGELDPRDYLGLELELSQALLARAPARRRVLRELVATLEVILRG